MTPGSAATVPNATSTCAHFQQRTRRMTADFPRESPASLQQYDGSNMAARLHCCTLAAERLRGSLFRHINACNAVAFGSVSAGGAGASIGAGKKPKSVA